MGEKIVSDSQTMTLSLTDAAQAEKFVDLSGGYIRVLVRTRGQKGSSGDLYLRSYYIEGIVNEGLDDTIKLTNKAVSVTYVDDLGACWTLGDGYTLDDEMLLGAQSGDRRLISGTDYNLNEDRDEIELVASSAGRTMRAKYDQYYQMWVSNDMPDERLHTSDDTPTEPKRSLTLRLESLVGLE
jgi:hypothetical protein